MEQCIKRPPEMVVDHIDNCLFTAFSMQQHFLSATNEEVQQITDESVIHK